MTSNNNEYSHLPIQDIRNLDCFQASRLVRRKMAGEKLTSIEEIEIEKHIFVSQFLSPCNIAFKSEEEVNELWLERDQGTMNQQVKDAELFRVKILKPIETYKGY